MIYLYPMEKQDEDIFGDFTGVVRFLLKVAIFFALYYTMFIPLSFIFGLRYEVIIISLLFSIICYYILSKTNKIA